MKTAVLWILALLISSYYVLALANTSNVEITWTPPTHRADNTLLGLEEIQGYKIYYGKNKGLYTASIDVPPGKAYTITGLADGNYYFVMTAIDKGGRESIHSTEIHRTVISNPLQPMHPTKYIISIG